MKNSQKKLRALIVNFHCMIIFAQPHLLTARETHTILFSFFPVTDVLLVLFRVKMAKKYLGAHRVKVNRVVLFEQTCSKTTR